jgi:small-conductance mechanosensitive channel
MSVRRTGRQLLWRLVIAFYIVLCPPMPTASAESANGPGDGEAPPSISLPEDVEKAVAKEVKQVKAHFKKGARRVFERTPLGFDTRTVREARDFLLEVPGRVPALIEHAAEQGRLLGIVGSCLVLAFLGLGLYSLIWQKRILARLERLVEPLRPRMSETLYPLVLSLLKIVTASLIPSILLGLFHLVDALVEYQAAWFLLAGRLVGLWVLAALALNVLHEVLVGPASRVSAAYGRSIYTMLRVAALYVIAWTAVFWAAEAFGVAPAFVALLRFLVSLSVVLSLLLLLRKKRALLSLLPPLPYRGYQLLTKGLERFYSPVILLTFVSGLLWCAGYHRFCKILWVKTWAVAGVFVVVTLAYHLLQIGLERWANRRDARDENVRRLYWSIKALALYAAIIATGTLVLDLLGLLEPLRRILSFPILKVGTTPLSVWMIGKALVILLAFIYASRFIRACLDYKVYPSLGVDTGLAYAISICINYTLLAVGVVISLLTVGVDLRMLAIFAGALGVGLGFGLQHMVANIVSGLAIIFGGTIRKGDIIRVGDAVGVVQEIGLRATMVRTFDHLEYLVPNAEFVTGTVVNYTLSSPLTRLQIPVGVSYTADPEVVSRILLEQAEANPGLDKTYKPDVWFDSYGESSLNFILLVWIDIRVTNAKKVKSELYHAIFKALRQAGIEIPFPQRDVHIRSSVPLLGDRRS